MSNRNIYEVFCRENQTFRALETVEVFTNLTLDLSDDELCFFKIEESLYRLHGLVSLETCIFCEKNERLALKIAKICKPSFATLGVKTFYEQTFGESESFILKEGSLLGKVFLINFNES